MSEDVSRQQPPRNIVIDFCDMRRRWIQGRLWYEAPGHMSTTHAQAGGRAGPDPNDSIIKQQNSINERLKANIYFDFFVCL